MYGVWIDTHFRAAYSTIVLDLRGAETLLGNNFLLFDQVFIDQAKAFVTSRRGSPISSKDLTCMKEIRVRESE